MLPGLISVIIAFSILGSAITGVTLNNFFVASNNLQTQQALNMAEAGINYYQWHLDINATNYTDGTTNYAKNPTLGYGPYVHNYVGANGRVEGTYTLYIKPPVNNSTIVQVTSIGQVLNSSIKQTVQAQIGVPSFASYGVVSDSALWFGATETADGPVDSNQGIRMDGPSTSTVSSANSSYVPSTSLGGNGTSPEPGVWCSTTVTTPVNCNTRSKADWVYPVPTVNFNEISSSLCNMKQEAFSEDSLTAPLDNSPHVCSQTPKSLTAAYLPARKGSYSPTEGYLIQLNPDNTYNLYDVNGQNDAQSNYQTALSLTAISSNIPIPSKGVIFAEANVWVLSNPDFNGNVSIAAGRLTASNSNHYANIEIAGPLVYGTKNGSDTIGLIAQNSVIIAPYAPPPPSDSSFTFEVDAALLAENGNVWFPDVYQSYPWYCTTGWVGPNQKFLFYGSVGTRQTWTWTWLDGSNQCGNAAYYSPESSYISGILNNTTQYDYNLKYNPPPDFPLTSGYSVLSWRQILLRP